MWAWGYNWAGQLGDGTTTNRITPVQVMELSGVEEVDAGSWHNLALKKDGTVWTWGWNGNGELGDGTTTNRYTPLRVRGLSSVEDVAGGAYHSLVVRVCALESPLGGCWVT